MGADSMDSKDSGGPAPSTPSPRIPLYTTKTANMPEAGYHAGQAPLGVVPRRGVEQAIDIVIKAWATNYPNEVTQFEAYMEKIRARRGEESTVFTSETRAYRLHAEIPAKIYYGVGHALGCPDWILDEKVRNTFFERFRACLTTRKVEIQHDPN